MTAKSTNSRKSRAAETKNKIYKSAEYLFSKNGFDAVSVDDIVKLANVAKGSFYVHFKSKDELIAILINENVKKVDMDYKIYFKSLPQQMPIEDKFLSLIGKIADVITDEIGYENMRNLYKSIISNDVKNCLITDYNRDLYTIFNDIIISGINQQVFQSDFSQEEIARKFVTVYRGLTFEWCIHYPDFNLRDQAISTFEILLGGIMLKKQLKTT